MKSCFFIICQLQLVEENLTFSYEKPFPCFRQIQYSNINMCMLSLRFTGSSRPTLADNGPLALG